MKAGRILIIFIGLLFYNQLRAQLSCVTADYSRAQLSKDPLLANTIQQTESFVRQAMARAALSRLENGVIRIPVVIHNLYHTAEQKVTDAQVVAQLDMLNRAFRRQNPDTVKTPAVFKSRAADCEVEFHLATSDPRKHSSSGILRKYTPVTKWVMDDKMKFSAEMGDDAWDSKNYLNIWVCNMERFAGYASIPGCAPELDGIVLGLAAFGAGQKTVVHEAGHWMGLKHLWGDEYCGDDGVEDTPKQASYTSGCPSTVRITCGNNPTGDMYNNYMDFTNDACMNLFTRGQKDRMHALFAPGGVRNSLLNSAGLDKPQFYETPVPEEDPRWLEVKMYPNPASSELYLDFSYDVRWIGKTIFVSNLLGQRLMNVTIKTRVQTLNIAQLKPGVYFLAAKNDEGLSIKMKFVKL